MFAESYFGYSPGGRGGTCRFVFEEDDYDEYGDYDDWDEQEEESEAKFLEYAEILGVDLEDALSSPDVLKRSYHRLALKYHPDKYRPENHEDAKTKEEAEETLKLISNAYGHLVSRFEEQGY